jgi:hypothetical protein
VTLSNSIPALLVAAENPDGAGGGEGFREISTSENTGVDDANPITRRCHAGNDLVKRLPCQTPALYFVARVIGKTGYQE